MNKAKCQNCDKPFKARYPTDRYCSPKCRKKALRFVKDMIRQIKGEGVDKNG